MTTETELKSGRFVEFLKAPSGGIFEKINYAIPIPQPGNFKDYLEDARLVLRVLKGECTQEEALKLPEFGYNALGCDLFLAALAWVLLEEDAPCPLDT